jgi:membrane fusion protein, multidrug efflux system
MIEDVRMTKRFALPLSAIAILLCVGAVSSFAQRPDAPGGKGGSANRPTPVIVEAVRADTFADTIKAVGTLKANESIVLTSTVTETVTAVNFTDGQRVYKGDVLVEMTDGEERALVAQQKSILEEARRQLSRARALHKQGAVSGATLDQRQRDFSSAEQAMLALQSRLKDYIILAPFDGVIGISDVSVGALLQPGKRIATLDDVDVMKLDFTVPSVFLPSLNSGLTVKARAKGFEQEFTGKVTAIDTQINEITRSILVRSLIDNPDGTLKPGLLMNVLLETEPRDALVISEMALIPEGEKNFVFIIDEAQTPALARKTEVQIGARRTGEVEILNGLKAGEKVVIYGTMAVRNQAPVTIQATRTIGESLPDILKRIGKNK